jgi:hypothetical protein
VGAARHGLELEKVADLGEGVIAGRAFVTAAIADDGDACVHLRAWSKSIPTLEDGRAGV